MDDVTAAALPPQRSLRSLPARFPRWLWLALLCGGLMPLLALAVLQTMPHSADPTDLPIPHQPERNFVPMFAAAFCAGTFVVSVLVLLVSLPVFLFSGDAKRVKRAGGLVKTTLGFLVGSAGTILATITLKS